MIETQNYRRDLSSFMRGLYNSVDSILNRVDFGKIWPGFQRFPFALYNGEGVFLNSYDMPYDSRFIGNTSIAFDGGFLAIWRVDDPGNQDPEKLASNIVHEMFHAFQQISEEPRFPDDLAALAYPENENNFTLKYIENQILADAFLENDISAKKAMLERFMAARKFREGIIGNFIKCEYQNETIEGMADYAGLSALKQISPKKFGSKIAESLHELRRMDETLFDIRSLSYSSGAIFCFVARDAGIDILHKIGETEKTVFEIASAGISPKQPEAIADDLTVGEILSAYIARKKLEFDGFHKNHSETVTGNFHICGYDPMNMKKLGDNILCSHFIMLMDECTNEKTFVQGPVMVTLAPGSSNRVLYYTK